MEANVMANVMGANMGANAMGVNPMEANATAFEIHAMKEREKERKRILHAERVNDEKERKRSKKMARQQDHEKRMQVAQNAKHRKKLERLHRVQEEKRKHAERDERAINVQLDMDSLSEEVTRRFSQYGEIEQVKWDQFTCSFSVLFKTVDAAVRSVKDGEIKLDCDANMEARLVRGWCVHFPDPQHLAHRGPKEEAAAIAPAIVPGGRSVAGATTVTGDFQGKVKKLFSQFGKVRRVVSMRGFLVVELDGCEAVFLVEQMVRNTPDGLKVNGEVLEPILTGVPKRSVEKVLARF